LGGTTTHRKRYKQWTDEEEKKLLSLISKRKIADMSDRDWAEIAKKLRVCPQ
jgi:hypothetical protein